MEYFKKLQQLLATERAADRKLFDELLASTSVNDRRQNGMSWYPVAIRDTEMTRGDYLIVELERTTHQDIPHQFRFGASAVLFSNHNAKEDRLEGVITYQGGNRLKLNIRTDELPDWSRNGKLGVDLLFDENSYNEMQSALKQAIAIADNNKENQLLKILTGEKKPGFRNDLITPDNPVLNSSQNEAVAKILSANELAIVHGPPGTGKTTTLVQAIKTLIQQQPQQVLVAAPSNAAVDLLSEKLSGEGLNVIRIGNPARVSGRLMSLTLDSKIAEHSSTKEIRKMKKQANELRNMAHKYKRNFGKAEREQRKALFDEAHRILKDVEKTEDYITRDLLSKAQVIVATLVGCNHYTISDLKFHTAIIDEAGQALEPATWIPVLKAEKLVLAGDHCQLPPTIKSEEAAKNGLAETLMEKCVRLHPEAVVLLEEQYRMNETIMQFSSERFYDGRLRANPLVARHRLAADEAPLQFIDTAGCGFEEKREGAAIDNPEEAAFVVKHLAQLVNTLANNFTIEDFPTVGVISPYRMQLQVLEDQVDHTPELTPYRHKITVNTIDSFQGQERDIIYISMTRSNADSSIGFLADIRRMNVAMTRARKKLVVVGDSATLGGFGFYANFIAYAEKNDAYISAWEFVEL
ncbi:MAG: AAA family ATPase [Chitinophagaceae bacterium]|nr:AAA family ATPase [Chitinophagaceae bacterium]MCW5928489.1 AAA family ATPase [Chitinophagaceae bacterium]